MGTAIAKTLAERGQKVFVYDKNYFKAAALAKTKNIVAQKNLKNLFQADFVILAVKPFHLADLNIRVNPSAVLISIAAGVKISKLQKLFGHKKVVRLMPNLGLSVGLGIAGWKSAGLSSKEKAAVKQVLDKITENFEVKNEKQINSVTAISGSGPAYFFAFALALQKAARALGFNAKQARMLAEKTFLAAAALQSGREYQDLINQVASKKGTTEQALEVFKKSRLEQIVLKAAIAAQKRAREISNE